MQGPKCTLFWHSKANPGGIPTSESVFSKTYTSSVWSPQHWVASTIFGVKLVKSSFWIPALISSLPAPLNWDQSKVVQFCCKEGLLDLGGATGIVGGTGDAEAGRGSAVPDGLGVVERTADRGSRSAKGSVKWHAKGYLSASPSQFHYY